MDHEKDHKMLYRDISDEEFEAHKTWLLDGGLMLGDRQTPGDITQAGVDIMCSLIMAWTHSGHSLEELSSFIVDVAMDHLGRVMLDSIRAGLDESGFTIVEP